MNAPTSGSGHSTELPAGSAAVPATDHAAALRVLVYSDDPRTRDQVRLAIGRRPAADLPFVQIVECATEPAVITTVDAGGIDVIVLDGEAVPAGGLGLCRALKDEIYRCPPVVVLTGRADDLWLAAWSRADAAVPHPLDPVQVADAVARLARARLATSSTRRA
ncbi:MAG: response regulator [Actinomycetes bacterium]